MVLLEPFALIDGDTAVWTWCVRLLVAGFFGGCVGWDRELRGHDAGLRTHVMVALGAAAFTLVAFELIDADARASTPLAMDPLRIVAAIVGGVGFLGAGAIIRDGGQVRGLTTAAGLWVVSAIGIAAGSGHYLGSLAVTLLAVLTIVVLRRLEKFLPRPAAEEPSKNDARHTSDSNHPQQEGPSNADAPRGRGVDSTFTP